MPNYVKMKCILPAVLWLWQLLSLVNAQGGIGFGIKREIFFLNLEDGYFGCQVNESTTVLQLYELSRLCDGKQDCYKGSDELRRELKCTNDCEAKEGTPCQNGACLDSLCHCNDGYGGCSCQVPDENECKYRPCDVFAHCTNSLGSFTCSCFPGYVGDGFHCQDINECEDPAIASRCVQNAECCNLPSHFLCKCKPGYVGDGEVECKDIDECLRPDACGNNAICRNTPGNYTCDCQPGFVGNPYDGCMDVNECSLPNVCGPGSLCTNFPGGHHCECPEGYTGDAYGAGCHDVDECSRSPCGKDAQCHNNEGSFRCSCPPGFVGDPFHSCKVVGCSAHYECPSGQACIANQCQNPCQHNNPCNSQQDCQVQDHQPVCLKLCQCQKNVHCQNGYVCDGCNCVLSSQDPVAIPGCDHCPTGVPCDTVTGACAKAPGTAKKPQVCESDTECLDSEACYMGQCENLCSFSTVCAPNAKCHVIKHRPVCSCPPGYEGNPATKCYQPKLLTCNTNNDCTNGEVCIQQICQNQCNVHNPCAQNAACINTAHGVDCSCVEGFQGNGFVGCLPVRSYKPICQYNEDCPPDKLCDRLNRVCINPCAEDSCGENAECYPVNHGTECRCLQGHQGNPYISCASVTGCRSNNECSTNEACINGKCSNPCRCGPNAVCDVVNHKATCKCLAGYNGNPLLGCQVPQNPCDPNPCGMHALCEIDNGNPICYCPKGMTGNPFKSCIPEGDECSPNPCGPYSGCRVVQGSAVCFCLSEYEGDPPITPCRLPTNPCTPSPCGPNTQCTLLDNGFAKCTCLPGYIESPNTIRGCVEKKNPCEPNPCGQSAVCDPNRQPSCFCPEPLIGNPYKFCGESLKTLCQPGPCGANADCYVTGSNEQCYCKNGYSGNPYDGCISIPTSPCEPNPCGKYAYCKISSEGKPLCSCPDGMGGDPLTGCKGPECTTNDDCPWDKSCLGYKCNNPCPGACGVGASCKVEKHRPVCTCNRGLTGNPFFRCYQISSDPAPTGNPCLPNPCGINTECKIQNRKPVCTCLTNFVGDPKTGCQPECVLNTDCKNHQACIDYRCRDPCAFGNICGLGAVCQCKDHTPLCSCREGFVGDPFLQCLPKPDDEPFKNMTLPCAPSPCDPYSSCNVYGGQIAMCDPCSSIEQQWNPQCHPQCLYNSDCPFNLACVGQKCIDPCPGSCGIQAECTVVYHNPICSCQSGLIGNPYEHCTTPKQNDVAKPISCDQVQCGANAVCKKSNGMTICVCRQQYYGNPYLSCRPECVINTDCGQTLSCINNKCVNPCLGVCGVNAQCQVVNHFPVCFCQQDYSGDPFVSCYQAARPNYPPIMGPADNACDPSPCGSNSRCHISEQGFATCSCLPGYRGSPPVCKPECVVSAECPQTQACLNQKCVDPCPGTCGVGANCHSICHNPICSCPPGHVGDPFVSCYLPLGEETPKVPGNPCEPTPCGPNSICEIKKGHPVCSCSPNYIGSPPYCRPECIMNHECPHNKACIQEKCQNPCTKSCGLNAKCDVVNHTPFCTCVSGYEGDAFISCTRIPPTVLPEIPRDPCNPSPCGDNTQCFSENNGVSKCVCIPPYIGNPYSGGCRPECLMNSDCMSNLACLASHCRDPCPGVCGLNAQCNVVSHIPVCTCFPGYIGDPFQSCRIEPINPPTPQNPCEPSPCGPNSQCRTQGYNAVCSCIQGFIGTPPSCRPECVVSAECPVDKACIAQKCSDPCPGTCGLHARCNVINHNPICTCPPKFVGDPFVRCIQEEPKTPPVVYQDPCFPSPCGANSECREHDSRPVCSCLPGMLGAPPNCRPECLIHADCPTRLACLQSKCRDPCTGSCGFNSRCTVINHQPVCSCEPGYQGDPFNGCNAVAATERSPEAVDPCYPSPCGPNSDCVNRNGVAACTCSTGFFGDPYTGCRRECENNDDCNLALACIGYKCIDPCPGTCGSEALCTVVKHIPICSCPPSFTGDPFTSCRPIPVIPTQREPIDPCHPSPCGPNSQCRKINDQAVCSCLPNYMGSPPVCRPECVVSSECPLDKACTNQKCLDPCPNTCGIQALCTVRNHNPICACPAGYSGDPFSHCALIPTTPTPPVTERPASCYPTPCGPNSQCQIQNGIPVCSCLPDFIGSPPSCRPECVISAECPSQLACMNQKCRDPCIGSCGLNANCHVLNHIPICTCNNGLTGDPFDFCTQIQITTERPLASDPCNPSPCGPNAICKGNGNCECLPEYTGNPYENCRPECVLNTECSRDKACMRNKCSDPCIGTCGQGANCDVVNHIPICSCPTKYSGDPFTICRPVPDDVPVSSDPCSPSPCGAYSQCRNSDNHAVCSCLPNYIGAPPSCRPECTVSSECNPDKACVNMKCINPCIGACGSGARCEVINHSPICSCREGQTGDPFRSCYTIPKPVIPPQNDPPKLPCDPSPCGPNSQCIASGNNPSCSCLPSYIGAPPNCRPECIINPDCPSTLACINNKCRDPCPGSCGSDAHCQVVNHAVSCLCPSGFTGNPFVQCIYQQENLNPCEPSPCGSNAICKQQDGAGSCSCINDYYGNPYEGCRPECVHSSDCPTNKACIGNKCVDPCPGVCGVDAVCTVISHVPTCNCISGYIGNPFTYCQPQPPTTQATVYDPCHPSPCGPNSQCKNVNQQGVCSCQIEYQGTPPNCRPECVVNNECPSNRACHKFKCTDPCPGTCGLNARCEVINHSPICTCSPGLIGDPFTRCYPQPVKPLDEPVIPTNPCIPSPCGPNSECRPVGNQPSCSCRTNYVGAPPNCRPECSVNSDCPSMLSCISDKCRDPCYGSCGLNTDCRVQNHIPTCTCISGHNGDPFTQCIPIIEQPTLATPTDPCNPSPCGSNTQCYNGVCKCLTNYFGDPLIGCRPECTMNTDCPRNKACLNQKCQDPCPGTCGQGAICDVINHIPTCSCPIGTAGDAFVICRPIKVQDEPSRDPCNPSPCGPNSVCRVVEGHAVCSCQNSMIGSPPSCRPECVVSAECPLTQACLMSKCRDPCPGTCGHLANCKVVNHSPICTCPPQHSGDPFRSCYPVQEIRPTPSADPINVCVPSPCGPNSECRDRGGAPACSCLSNYVGTPPSCRPECTINPECPSHLSCINQKCTDPCPGSCGSNAACSVINHTPMCSCNNGFTGDPFTYCQSVPAVQPTPTSPSDPCYPSPCGPNARCRVENQNAICECLPEYQGNPYESCRPECLVSSDCTMNKACIRNKCQDPCPGTCGISAICFVSNHIPICSCPESLTGDPFQMCHPIPVRDPIPSDPCVPSPCGPNTRCRIMNGAAICECLQGYEGSPSTSGCRPECVISPDCPRNRACVNNKCVDPCIGVCGYDAICQTINHSPVCSCPPPTIGDPFVECKQQPALPSDPCNPSPCGSNGQCRVIGKVASCVYPECIINQDCPRDKACFTQKCQDPCRDVCGLNAICQVVNHNALCSCPPGYYGEPKQQCIIQRTPEPKPECTTDGECSNDKACINYVCKDPCQESPTTCARNALCYVQKHRSVCVCRDGMTGNAQIQCVEIGCRADTDCPPEKSCVNGDCVDPCAYTHCGINALCRTDGYHRARCYCPPAYEGDPFVECRRPECVVDSDCPSTLACRNQHCQSPCDCAPTALCNVANHIAACRCPPGYIGNPHTSCTLTPLAIPPQCTMDSDCASKLACFNGDCKNPCFEIKPCGPNAECIVVDTLPHRTMSCQCIPGYVGDADIQCKLGAPSSVGCISNDDCQPTDLCLNRQCVNPCTVSNPCSSTAICTINNHKAVCKCPDGLSGDPFISCYKVPLATPECTTDSECPSSKICANQYCQDPCQISKPCDTTAECVTINHRPICNCPNGWAGNPQIQCYKPGCKTDSDCVYDKACINSNCLNPCSTQSCGHGADCIVQAHKAHCICPAGTQGSPMVSCVSVVCQYNEDCADHEACDRLNRRCRPVCEQDTCAEQATCLAQAHQPTCTCLNGFQGNPYIECIESRVPSITPECTTDSDCPSQHACVNQRCQNPCTISVLCSPDQECHVQDTVPYRTIMCQCRSDTVATIDGGCKPIVSITPQCKSDQECPLSERCVNQGCVEACRIDPCGINAQCISQNHQAACSCPPGYTGNPHTECSLQQSIPILPPSPECTKNDDCASDTTCINQRCVSPCTLGDSCGRGSFCHSQNHQPVCRCPNGYTGDPRIACTPPSSVPTVQCVSSTDCPAEESCINRMCVSPCNCGPNSDCKVNNHYPSCICKPGYYGNPQQGCIKMGCISDDQCAYDKQCYNGECVPPCLLSDPCAPTAKCYGDNHRAACQCPPGYFGNPFDKCERTECTYDVDCPSDRMCFDQHCINPCTEQHGTPCASNAICSVRNHAAACRCPENFPMGDPNTYCERSPPPLFGEPECKIDVDCSSRLACIREKCVNPCHEIKPCSNSATCAVLDSVPVRTMTCTCSEGWVLNEGGECRQVVVSSPPGCTTNDECPSNEACLNRQCRNPCNCGTNAQCFVQNHHPVCSCLEGYDGNPNFACRIVGCKRNSECESGKACINGHCLNPCIVEDPCGPNAECFTVASRPECRCKSGYRGNPYDRCLVIGCRSNNDCPNDRSCINGQCINPCVYEHPCSSQAECKVQNHFALCRCPPGMAGNPYVACRQEVQPECKEDADCPSLLACFDSVCRNPCTALEPCKRPAECVVIDSLPVRTMICECPSGYVSSGSGTCKITPPMTAVACTADTQCPSDRACLNGRCIDPCNCGPNSECRVWDHKPVCSCLAGFDGSPEIDCSRAGCRSESDCSGQHTCVNRICVAVCAADGSSCGTASECYGINHQAVCECPPGMTGNPQIACVVAGCRSDTDCPSDKACINTKCIDPCTRNNPCVKPAECTVYNHRTDCACPPGYVGNAGTTCKQIETGCQSDSECPSQTGCINKLCVSPCDVSSPCGTNSKCKVLDTFPIRTMTCECLPGTQGNAAIRCDEVSKCPIDKGYVRNDEGECVCPPGTALNQEDECRRCVVELGYKIDERGHCVCALDRGLIIDERGRCICPTEHGYSLNIYGQCVPKNTTQLRTDFPRPDMVVTCLSDGVQVEIHITEKGFNGVLYVKGHSKNEQCRRVVSMAQDSSPKTEIFKVNFGNCGLIHINGQASFVLVIQKHPKLVTYKAQAYHIRCVYNTGEQNVTLGFNVSMLTTAGTIANTGPPPTCLMKIVTHTGQEIDSAEIGDNLMLQVDVQPSSIYGGYARSCVAKTIEDNVENEYIVTDENGCATDPTIFGEWDYNADTQSLLAGFNAFKFPSSDNIRFQCNIRVCFGKCQPVNCRGYNAFGRRRRREISKNDNGPDDDALESAQRGQLREEITIESNAILTFERREERLMDPTEAPIIQPAEDICVSVIGLIVALVITALLALVAVAVAVSCWLMAYRRTPNVNGPLPHPTQVPNPMFMNHDRTSSEPSPDYLT